MLLVCSSPASTVAGRVIGYHLECRVPGSGDRGARLGDALCGAHLPIGREWNPIARNRRRTVGRIAARRNREAVRRHVDRSSPRRGRPVVAAEQPKKKVAQIERSKAGRPSTLAGPSREPLRELAVRGFARNDPPAGPQIVSCSWALRERGVAEGAPRVNRRLTIFAGASLLKRRERRVAGRREAAAYLNAPSSADISVPSSPSSSQTIAPARPLCGCTRPSARWPTRRRTTRSCRRRSHRRRSRRCRDRRSGTGSSGP